MKSLSKILTTISTIGIATISLASCGTTSADGYVAVPKEYLNIDGTEIKGLTEDAKTQGIPSQYTKITIPKNIVKAHSFISSEEKLSPGYTNIKKIDFESNSECTTIGYQSGNFCSSLANLTTIVLPPKLNYISEHAILNCRKLIIIDISNVNNIDCLVNTNWIELNGTEQYYNGTLIINKSHTSKVNGIISKNQCLNKMSIKVV